MSLPLLSHVKFGFDLIFLENAALSITPLPKKLGCCVKQIKQDIVNLQTLFDTHSIENQTKTTPQCFTSLIVLVL